LQTCNNKTEQFTSPNEVGYRQGDQIGRNFAIWAIYYGIGQIFF
jgi:hypothetical protein